MAQRSSPLILQPCSTVGQWSPSERTNKVIAGIQKIHNRDLMCLQRETTPLLSNRRYFYQARELKVRFWLFVATLCVERRRQNSRWGRREEAKDDPIVALVWHEINICYHLLFLKKSSFVLLSAQEIFCHINTSSKFK